MGLIYGTILTAGVCACVVVAVLVNFGGGINGRESSLRLLRSLLWLCMALLMTDIAVAVLSGRSRAALLCLYTLRPILYALFCTLWLYFCRLYCFDEHTNSKVGSILYALPLTAILILSLLNVFTPLFFAVSKAVLVPTPAYGLFLIPFFIYAALASAIACIGAARTSDQGQKQRCLALILYSLLPTAALAAELLAPGLVPLNPVLTLSLLWLCLRLQRQSHAEESLEATRNAESAARMKLQMANSRMMIMLSQIQPHFLYNALCVIQDLCHGKAPEAEQATIAFSRFLRGNLDSLNTEHPIAFAKELEHTRYYLTLEQMRFGSRLRVEYALEVSDFCLPAMTLQPIVENAVRYGVIKREEGGTVRITSTLLRDNVELVVEDDGVGFDPMSKHEDGRTHIGIDNVSKRLREMCGGELCITSTEGVGTVARLIIPKGGGGV